MISRTGGGRIEIPQLYVPPKIALLNTRIPLLKEQLKMPPKARGKAKMPKNPSHTSSKKSGFMEPPLPFSRVPGATVGSTLHETCLHYTHRHSLQGLQKEYILGPDSHEYSYYLTHSMAH